MKTYTLFLTKDHNDQISYHEFSGKENFIDENRSFYNYDKILEYSIDRGYIKDKNDIHCFCDGSFNIAAHFTPNYPEYEARNHIEEGSIWDEDNRPDFDENIFEYNFF